MTTIERLRGIYLWVGNITNSYIVAAIVVCSLVLTFSWIAYVTCFKDSLTALDGWGKAFIFLLSLEFGLNFLELFTVLIDWMIN